MAWRDKMDISFIHTADVHIGKKFTVGFNASENKKRRRELWETFDKIIEICIRNHVNFLFVSGDLTDAKYATMDDIKRLALKFKEAERTRIIITTGNRDACSDFLLYPYVDWSDNVYWIQEAGQIKKIEFPDKNLAVYGVGVDLHTPNQERHALYNLEIDRSQVNILLAHGDVYGNDPDNLKLDIERLENQFDYIALGHVHQYNEYNETAIYSGTPEPLDFSEKGQHGVVYGTLKKGHFEKVFVPVAKRKFITREIFIQPDYGYQKLLDIIKFSGDYISVSKDYFRIILTGEVSFDINMEKLKLEAASFFHYIEFDDQYLYAIDFEALLRENADNIIGDYIRHYQQNQDCDIECQKAFMLGLDALMKERVR
jgi:DNA repair protein SbcD/Mre11